MSDVARLSADLARVLRVDAVAHEQLEAGKSAGEQLRLVKERLATEQVALISVEDSDLRPGMSQGWTAASFTEALESAGLEIAWIGLTDLHGTVGRRSALTAAVVSNGGEAVREALAGGHLGLRLDPLAEPRAPDGQSARVCIASYEFVGPTRTGGIGTAYTSLAEALAEAGHEVTVLFTGWEDPVAEPLARWVDRYRERGIELAGLPPEAEPSLEAGHRQAARALQAYRWLRDEHERRSFDVIHFPEVLGHGYFAVSAKRQGLAFEHATIVIGSHSSTTWVLETNGILCQSDDDFADEFIERRSVEGADVLISPSAYMLDWMRSKGWRLPDRHFVQQYVRSRAVEDLIKESAPSLDDGAGAGAAEVVFFGRLEARKGLRVFCDALDRLAKRPDFSECTVTFLGKESTIDGVPASEYVARRSADWPWPTTHRGDLNQPQAVAYLHSPGHRVTVIPSLIDNSPNTVYEVLALQIPIIASRVGGTAELIDPLDLARATFDPGEGLAASAGADSLAEHIAADLAADHLEPPRAAVDAGTCREGHLAWHAAIAAAPSPSPVRKQASRPVSVCVVGADPGARARTRASIETDGGVAVVEAIDHAAAPPGAELVLFLTAGMTVAAGALDALVGALESSGADAVTPLVATEDEDGPVIRVPVGGPPLAGLFRRCFGDDAFLIVRSTLDQLGGFDSDVDPRDQAHQLLCRAAIHGHRIEVVPEPLVSAPAGTLSELAVARPAYRSPDILRAYAEAPAPVLADLPLLAQQLAAAVKIREQYYSDLYRNRFGRISVQVRYFVHKYRQLQALWARLRQRRG